MFKVEKVIGYDRKLDIAVIKICKENLYGSPVYGFTALSVANSDNIKAGQVVYALGSPFGLQNTISNGIISNACRIIADSRYIQMTAPISGGSSGGALINEYGEVLGINAAGINEGQNIGFSIPVNCLDAFDLTGDGVTYDEFAAKDLCFTVKNQIAEIRPNEQKDFILTSVDKPYYGTLYAKSSDESIFTCEIIEIPDNKYEYILRVTSKDVDESFATVNIYSREDPHGVFMEIYVGEELLEDIL